MTEIQEGSKVARVETITSHTITDGRRRTCTWGHKATKCRKPATGWLDYENGHAREYLCADHLPATLSAMFLGRS